MQAKPSSEEEKQRLVDELKRRGNAAFKSGSYPEALVLYGKAIEHVPTEALYSNRSMTHASMGMFKESLEDAENAVKINPSWAKGYFRKANAELGMNLFDLATQSLQKVLSLEPTDKAAKKILETIPNKKAEYAGSAARESARRAQEAEERKEELAKDRIISRKMVELEKEPKIEPAKKVNDASMRGYKVLADGRKTTFFNRELSEEDKKILGEIKHEKLVTPSEETTHLESGASVWNTGGTFEERQFTEWARDRLTVLLKEVCCPVSIKDADGDVDTEDIKVTEVLDLEGDASIAFTRKKKRHIFDFNLSVKWSVILDGENITGIIFFPDISGDSVIEGEDLEFELRWSDRAKAKQNESAITKVMKDTSVKGMPGRLVTAINKFANEFREIV